MDTQFAWIIVFLFIAFLGGMLTMWLLLHPYRKLESYREQVQEAQRREAELRQVLQQGRRK